MGKMNVCDEDADAALMKMIMEVVLVDVEKGAFSVT